MSGGIGVGFLSSQGPTTVTRAIVHFHLSEERSSIDRGVEGRACGGRRHDASEPQRYRPSERQTKINYDQLSYSVAEVDGFVRVYSHVPKRVGHVGLAHHYPLLWEFLFSAPRVRLVTWAALGCTGLGNGMGVSVSV